MNAGESAFRVLKSADFRSMPWKNGGGETVEIAIFPDNATLDNFDWRVSMARVGVDGPFSIFHGVDRTLAILQGVGIELAIEPRAAQHVTKSTRPLAFDAGLATQARLLDGPVIDLNLMTRRDRFSHRMTRMALGGPTSIKLCAQETLLLTWDVGVRVETGHGMALLDPHDALFARDLRSTLRLAPARVGHVYLIEIFALTDA